MTITATRMRKGELKKNENHWWEIDLRGEYPLELSCGSVIELNIGGVWIRTRIEHGSNGYYATTRGVQLCTGLTARIPE